MRADGGAKSARQMWAAHAPVQTGAAGRAAAACLSVGLEDSEGLHACAPAFRKGGGITRDLDRAVGAQGIGDADAKFSR